MDRQTGRPDLTAAAAAAAQSDAAVTVAVHDGETINNDQKVQWFISFHALCILIPLFCGFFPLKNGTLCSVL